MKKITFLIALLTLCFNTVNGQTNFGWETAVVSPANVTTETVGSITLTTTNNDSNIGTANWGGWMGTTDNIATCPETSSVAFVFDQAVDVASIIVLESSTTN
ncbi:MAG: hypothetical protein ABJK28_06280, partial [Algibacter sp.]